MIMKRIVGALLVVMALGSTETAFAFNGERQGFLLGFGIGASSYKISDKDGKIGLETDLKIGYGFTNQFQVFYTNKVNFSTYDDAGYSHDESGLSLHGLSAIGANYYFSPLAPSFFVGGGVGLASHGDISTDSEHDSDSSESNSGAGFYISGGYEFARHWNVELAVIRDSIDYERGNRSAWTYMVTLNGLAY